MEPAYMAAIFSDGVLGLSCILIIASYSSRPPYFTACEKNEMDQSYHHFHKVKQIAYRGKDRALQVSWDLWIVASLHIVLESTLKLRDDASITRKRYLRDS